MHTKTIARWRRAALAGTLAATLAAPVARAQQGEQLKTAPAQDQQGQPAAQDQQAQPAAQDQQAQPAAQDQQAQPAAQDQQQPPAAQDQQAQPAAQDKQPQRAPPRAKNETAPLVTEQSPRPPPDTNIQPVPGTPEEYVIQKGDTLWDLSQKFLNNPWYWPKIWSNNPYIENPHWIYPGKKLRIMPGEGGAQAPVQVQAPLEPGVDATAANAQEVGSDITPPASPDLDVVSKSSRGGSNTVSASGKLAFSPPPVVTVRSSGLVSPEDLAIAGALSASFEEKEMLSTYDTGYVKFKGEAPVKPGDKLLAFHTVGDIVDPKTHRKLAVQTETTAVLKVLSVRGDSVTVQVERAFLEVGRGDLVRPWEVQEKRLTPRPNTTEVKGMIVQAVTPGVTTIGEAREVFIDKGTVDGVQEGNTFAVVRSGDGLSEHAVTDSYAGGGLAAAANLVGVPDENVGLLLVVDATEHLSTAIVIKSVRELIAGDKVEMHTSGGGGG